MDQLLERSLLTPEICSSIQVVGRFSLSSTVKWKNENIQKVDWMAQLKYSFVYFSIDIKPDSDRQSSRKCLRRWWRIFSIRRIQKPTFYGSKIARPDESVDQWTTAVQKWIGQQSVPRSGDEMSNIQDTHDSSLLARLARRTLDLQTYLQDFYNLYL